MVEQSLRVPRVGVRERVERSVFLSQLLLAAATLLLVPVAGTGPLYAAAALGLGGWFVAEAHALAWYPGT